MYSDATLIHIEPLELGEHTVKDATPVGFTGPCAVLRDDGSDAEICVLPSKAEAKKAAIYAAKPHGGFGSVIVVLSTHKKVTHTTFEDWAF